MKISIYLKYKGLKIHITKKEKLKHNYREQNTYLKKIKNYFN